jgi:hypothetical protein
MQRVWQLKSTTKPFESNANYEEMTGPPLSLFFQFKEKFRNEFFWPVCRIASVAQKARVARFFFVKNTKAGRNIPKCSQNFQMPIKYTKYYKWPEYITTVSILRSSKVYPYWDVWSEKKPSCNPAPNWKPFTNWNSESLRFDNKTKQSQKVSSFAVKKIVVSFAI